MLIAIASVLQELEIEFLKARAQANAADDEQKGVVGNDTCDEVEHSDNQEGSDKERVHSGSLRLAGVAKPIHIGAKLFASNTGELLDLQADLDRYAGRLPLGHGGFLLAQHVG